MSNRRNRDRDKGALRNKVSDLPPVSYEEAANATYGGRNEEIVNQWFGDIDPSTLNESGIQIASDGAIQAYEFRMTGVGIDPEFRVLSRDKWKQLGDLLFRFERSIQWLIGDWLAYGEENKWGEHEKIAKEMGYAKVTLFDYKYVASSVPFLVRQENLSFGHHKLVAGKDPEEQQYWLEKASNGDYDEERKTSKPWSISRLRKEMTTSDSDDEETLFDRNIRRIDKEITKTKWNRLPPDERLKRYQYLQSIINRMEQWGLD